MARDPKLMKTIEMQEGQELFRKLFIELSTAKKQKLVGDHVDIRDLFINMDALVMYPFIANIFCQHAFQFKNQADYTEWLKERRKKLPIFIKQALQPIKK
jgi:hypothetical protein